MFSQLTAKCNGVVILVSVETVVERIS